MAAKEPGRFFRFVAVKAIRTIGFANHDFTRFGRAFDRLSASNPERENDTQTDKQQGSHQFSSENERREIPSLKKIALTNNRIYFSCCQPELFTDGDEGASPVDGTNKDVLASLPVAGDFPPMSEAIQCPSRLNKAVKLRASDNKLSADAGALLFREVD